MEAILFGVLQETGNDCSKQANTRMHTFFPPWCHLQINIRACSYSQVDEGVFDSVEWDKWFYDPGLPPHKPVLV